MGLDTSREIVEKRHFRKRKLDALTRRSRIEYAVSTKGTHKIPSPVPPSPDFAIAIKDCNSITEARISLRRGSLNIKYGPNGIGKSTIARALMLNAQGDDALKELLPFKYRQQDDQPSPSVTGAEGIERVPVFDDAYVAQFAFQPEEVVKDSFES